MDDPIFSREYGIHCLAQHFAVWVEEIKNDRVPDFGSPCQGCKNQEACHKLGYPWIDILNPILQDHNVTLSLVQKER